MARTPLLRSLVQLAKDHQLAEQTGVPPAAIREQRALVAGSVAGLTRRHFLAGAAIGAGALALPRLARAGKPPKIAIVGAGISGLNAALTLADAGVASTVYEASGRIGGRMFSNNTGYWNDGQVSEWCGELIDTGHTTVRGLAKRFGLSLDDQLGAQPKGAEETYFFFGQHYPKAQADIDFGPVRKALNADLAAAPFPTLYNASTMGGRALDQLSVYDWIEARVPGGHRAPMGMLLDVAYNIEYGAETSDQSSLSLVYLLGFQPKKNGFAIFGESDEHYHIRGGNQQLPVAIADYLGVGNAVQLGERLCAVGKTSNGDVTLTFENGRGTKTVTVDLAILTIPFAVLRTLDYHHAGFDALKVEAITELGAGRNGKTQLQFTSRYWNGTGAWPGIASGTTFADTGYQASWESSRGQPGKSGILNAYSGGDTTRALKMKTAFGTASNPQAVQDAQHALAALEPVFPGISPKWNGKTTNSIPHLDPNFRLAYSY